MPVMRETGADVNRRLILLNKQLILNNRGAAHCSLLLNSICSRELRLTFFPAFLPP